MATQIAQRWECAMGVWGPGIFDNDYTLDWLLDLEKTSDLGLIERAFSAWEPGAVDAPWEALAAAEVVAAALGVPCKDLHADNSRLAGRMTNWIDRQRWRFSPVLQATAQRIVQAILDDPVVQRASRSGWRFPEDGLAWYDGIKDLSLRLACEPPSAP